MRFLNSKMPSPTMRLFRNGISCVLLCAASNIALSHNDVSHLVSYQASLSSQDLLDRVEDRGDEFLNVVNGRDNPPFCKQNVQRGLSFFNTLFGMVPGVGELSGLVDLSLQGATAVACRSNSGLKFTWDEIMDAVDNKIKLALTKQQRQQMRDLYGHYSLEFDSRVDRILLADKDLLSEDDILVLITELNNIIADMEIAETLFANGNKWSEVSFLPRLYGLKYNIHLVLDGLYTKHGGLEQTAFDHANLQMEQSRARAVKAVSDAVRDYTNMSNNFGRTNMTYSFKKSRSGFYATWKRNFKVKFFGPNGEVLVDVNSSCNGNPCGGISAKTWYNRRDRLLRDLIADYKEMRADIFSTQDASFRDFVEQVNYYKGKQLFLVSKRNLTRAHENRCLRPKISTGTVTSLISAPCSFGDHNASLKDVRISNRDTLPDSWRVHERTGLVIHEATGLCLDLADDQKQLTLNACQYTLDLNREQRSTQEWAIPELGSTFSRYIINRNTQQCLNWSNAAGSSVSMKNCDTTRMKSRELKLGLETIKFKPEQVWNSFHLRDCNDSGECAIGASIFDFKVPTRRVEAKKRLVLPADSAVNFGHNAFLNRNINGFSDTGFVNFIKRNDRVKWSGLQLVAGKYRISVFYQGSENAPTNMRLKMDINDKPITNGVPLPALAPGEYGRADFDMDIPAFGHSFAMRSRSDDGAYLIDKVIFTPIVE